MAASKKSSNRDASTPDAGDTTPPDATTAPAGDTTPDATTAPAGDTAPDATTAPAGDTAPEPEKVPEPTERERAESMLSAARETAAEAMKVAQEAMVSGDLAAAQEAISAARIAQASIARHEGRIAEIAFRPDLEAALSLAISSGTLVLPPKGDIRIQVQIIDGKLANVTSVSHSASATSVRSTQTHARNLNAKPSGVDTRTPPAGWSYTHTFKGVVVTLVSKGDGSWLANGKPFNSPGTAIQSLSGSSSLNGWKVVHLGDAGAIFNPEAALKHGWKAPAK